MITISDLKDALDEIEGKKVVILDACHSGGFIGKGKGEYIKADPESFNNEVINVFSQNELRNLGQNNYYILTSCKGNQNCTEALFSLDLEDYYGPYGQFTKALCDGCGFDGTYPADTNGDNKVTFEEAWVYAEDNVPHYWPINQNTQIWVATPNFSFVEDFN